MPKGMRRRIAFDAESYFALERLAKDRMSALGQQARTWASPVVNIRVQLATVESLPTAAQSCWIAGVADWLVIGVGR